MLEPNRDFSLTISGDDARSKSANLIVSDVNQPTSEFNFKKNQIFSELRSDDEEMEEREST